MNPLSMHSNMPSGSVSSTNISSETAMISAMMLPKKDVHGMQVSLRDQICQILGRLLYKH